MTTLTEPRQLAAAIDPVVRMGHAGIACDPWQEAVLRTSARRTIILASRQAGKTATVAAKALFTAETQPGSEIIIGAVKQAQSAEMLRRAKQIYDIGGRWADAEIEAESVLSVTFANRSRVTAVPGKAATVRSFSALKMLVIDEAAYVPDAFYQAVFPMLAISRGRAMLLSTANAKMGVFHDIWTNAPDWDFGLPADEQEDAWFKVYVPWTACPRIRPAFVDAERRRFGDRYVAREYECVFQEAVDAAFPEWAIAGAAGHDVVAWDVPA